MRIPTQLRNLTQGAAEVEAAGASVAEVIDDLERRYPGLKRRLLADDGSLRRFVNVYVGDEDVRFQQGLATPVHDGARMSIIPSVAGGA